MRTSSREKRVAREELVFFLPFEYFQIPGDERILTSPAFYRVLFMCGKTPLSLLILFAFYSQPSLYWFRSSLAHQRLISIISSGFQLDCLQCTSPTISVNSNETHSCVDGTLAPVPCPNAITFTASICSQNAWRRSLSLVGKKTEVRKSEASAGTIRRSIWSFLRFIHSVVIVIEFFSKSHDCDPSDSSVETSVPFYCARICLTDGCNRYTYNEIFMS